MIEDKVVFPPNGGMGYDPPAPTEVIEAPAPAPAYDAPEPVAGVIVTEIAPAPAPKVGGGGGIVANAPKDSQGGARPISSPSAGAAPGAPGGATPVGAPRVAPGAGSSLVDDPGATAAPSRSGARVAWGTMLIAGAIAIGIGIVLLAWWDEREKGRKQ